MIVETARRNDTSTAAHIPTRTTAVITNADGRDISTPPTWRLLPGAVIADPTAGAAAPRPECRVASKPRWRSASIRPARDNTFETLPGCVAPDRVVRACTRPFRRDT